MPLLIRVQASLAVGITTLMGLMMNDDSMTQSPASGHGAHFGHCTLTRKQYVGNRLENNKEFGWSFEKRLKSLSD